ncbi:MAG: phage/plasmid primase, P4 family [Candidatus Sulfotelmatobacter sp.]
MSTTATLANPLPNTLVVPPHAPSTETAAIELRAIKSSAARNDVWVGYFNDPAILAAHAKRLNEEGYHIYSPINPILQIDAVVAKLNQPPARGGATGNAGIARRLVLPYDIDAIRGIDEKATTAARAAAETRAAEAQAAAAVAPPEEATKAAQVVAAAEKAVAKLASDPIRHGAATNEERDAARSITQSIVNFWREHRVGPKVLDSGNGFQIFVPIDLPNDSDSEKLVRDVLAVHAVEFETPGVKLDCWSDAARILRIPGYLNVKGPNSDPTRPRRMVKQLNVASGLASREMLEEIRSRRTSTALDKPAPATSPMPEDETPEDEIGKFTLENVETMLAGISERESDFQFEAGKTTSYGPGFYVSCPNADEHSTPDGAIITGDDISSTAVVWVNERGWANFRCQHAHCQEIKWHRFVELTKSGDLQNVITKPWLAYGIHGSGAGAEDGPGLPEGTPFFSDISLAKIFAQEAKGKVAWLDREVWTRYDNGIWKDDPSARGIKFDLGEFLLRQQAVVDQMYPTSTDEEEEAKRARARSAERSRLCSSAKMAGVLVYVQVQPGMFLETDIFDKEPFLLGAPNGRVIDLKTGEIRTARAEDYLTKRVICLPGGDCPRWTRFMSEITGGNKNLQDYLQRSLGYCLTASVREETLAIWRGPGGNGKGSTIKTVQHILGDSDKGGYSCTIPAGVILEKRNDPGNQHYIAQMCGARLVVAHETGARKFNGELLKELTGNDRLSGEKKFEHPFNFNPTHKLIVTTNPPPRIEIDGAMKRRLHMVPFLQSFDARPTEEQKTADALLKETLQREAPGILKWLIEGCLNWQREGLNPPNEVLDYTAEFFAESDHFAAWLDQRCETKPNAKATNDELYANWKSFCEQGRGTTGTHNDLMAKLKSKGFKDCKIGRSAKRGKLGIALKQEDFMGDEAPAEEQVKKPCLSVGGFSEEVAAGLRRPV